MSDPVPKRRRFRYSLRTLFVVVAVFGCWLGYYVHWKNERHEARVWLSMQMNGGSFGFTPKPPSAFPWMLKLLGEEPTNLILMRNEPSDFASNPARTVPDDYLALVDRIERLFPEAVVMNLTQRPDDPAGPPK